MAACRELECSNDGTFLRRPRHPETVNVCSAHLIGGCCLFIAKVWNDIRRHGFYDR
jgi:hypothetical protein